MFALVCIIVPPFLALAIPAGILYCALLSYYSRTMQRIEAVQRAPAYALLSSQRRVDRRSAVLYDERQLACLWRR